MWSPPDDHDRPRPAAELADILERVQYVLLTAGATAIFIVAACIIVTMDGGSKSQGGRFYVAAGALVALGWVDSRFWWLARRRANFGFDQPPAYRRYLLRSAALLLLAAVTLFGLAIFLP